MDSTSVLASQFRAQQRLAKLYSPSPALSALGNALKPSLAMADSLRSIYTITEAARAWRNIAAHSQIGEISKISNWIRTSQLQTSTSFSALQTLAGEQNRFSKSLSALADIGSRLQSSLKLSPAWELQSKINAAMGPSLRLQQQLESAIGTRNKWMHDLTSFNRLIPKIENCIADFSTEDVVVGDDGSLTVTDQSVTMDEINDTVSDIIDSLDDTEEKQNFFELFFKEVDKLAKPLKIILVGIIWPIIIGITANLATPHIKELIKAEPNNKQTIVREIKKQTPQHFNIELLSNFRFVTATMLFVREGPSQKTKILDELVLGQVVRILYKKRNWTFVGYTDQDTGEPYEGWVFTRYIKKFKK